MTNKKKIQRKGMIANMAVAAAFFASLALAGALTAHADDAIDLPDWNPVTIDVSAPDPAVQNEGKASWYVHPRYPNELMAASTRYPKGTKLKVTNLANNKTVTVTVKDWGPNPIVHPDRVIDLGKAAFTKIASIRAGVIAVRVEEIVKATTTSVAK